MNEENLRARFLTLRELGKHLHRGMRAIHRDVKGRRIPVVKVGRDWRVPASYLDQLEQRAMDAVATETD